MSAFKASDITRAIKATRAAGIETFDVIPGPNGEPIIRIRPAAANDTPQDIIDEIEAWAREQSNDAA
jgi:hypothetical protein